MFFVPLRSILLTLLIVGWTWAIARALIKQLVSIRLAHIGALIVLLKWPSALICAVVFLVQRQFGMAAIAGLWPVVAMILIWFLPTARVGLIERRMASQLVGVPETELFSETPPRDVSGDIACFLTPLIGFFWAFVAWCLWLAVNYFRGT
jgi:hypothetical protein